MNDSDTVPTAAVAHTSAPADCVVRIGLLGPYGTGNLGDAAIQASAMSNIKRVLAAAHFVGISLNVADTAACHDIEAFPIDAQAMDPHPPAWLARLRARRLRNPVARLARKLIDVGFDSLREMRHLCKMWRFIRGIELLIISGGGQLSDYWGGPFKHPYTLWKWSIVTKLRGKKLACVSIGGVMPRARLSRFFLRQALSCSEYRSFRDVHSQAVASGLGIPAPNRMVPDLAFGYSATTADVKPEPEAPLTIGISPIAPQAWTRADDPKYRAYLDHLTQFAKDMLDAGHAVRLYPSQLRMDTPLVAGLFDRLSASCGKEEIARLQQWETCSVDTLLHIVGSADLIVASRLHGILLSLVAGTPVLALSYDPKVAALMEQVGLPQYCLEHDTLTLETLTNRFEELVADRVRVADHIRQTGANFRRQTTRQIEDMLMQLLPSHLPDTRVATVAEPQPGNKLGWDVGTNQSTKSAHDITAGAPSIPVEPSHS